MKKKNEMPTLLPPMSNHCHSFASNHITTLKSEIGNSPFFNDDQSLTQHPITDCKISPKAKFHRKQNFTENKLSPKAN
jgi:hypothetical protein